MKHIQFSDYNGVAISVDSDGTFCAELDGVFLRKPTFEQLKQTIETERKATAKSIKLALTCYGLVVGACGKFTVQPLTLEGLNRNDASLKWRERDDKGVSFAVPANEENLRLLRDYADAKNQANRLDSILKDRRLMSFRFSMRIQASEYAKWVHTLQTHYKNALDAQAKYVEGEQAS